MERPNLAENIKAAGYELKLTADWKQVKVSGNSRLPEPLRSQLKADKEQVRFWLMAETLAQHLEGKVVIETDVPPIYWANYPSGKNGSATPPHQSMTKNKTRTPRRPDPSEIEMHLGDRLTS